MRVRLLLRFLLNRKLLKHALQLNSIYMLLGVLVWSFQFNAFAGTNETIKLFTADDSVVAYTGPSEQFRMLAQFAEKTELIAASKVVSSPTGRYYKVVVTLSAQQKAIGYIPVNSNVKVGEVEADEEDLNKYGSVSLFSKAFQVSYAQLRGSQKVTEIGYIEFVSPGFYYKPFLGQWSSLDSSGLTLGGEIGNDSLLVGATSGYISLALGLFSPATSGSGFLASSKTNVLMSASTGIRYNVKGFAAVALGLTQMTFYNQNYSLITNGIRASIEVGL